MIVVAAPTSTRDSVHSRQSSDGQPQAPPSAPPSPPAVSLPSPPRLTTGGSSFLTGVAGAGLRRFGSRLSPFHRGLQLRHKPSSPVEHSHRERAVTDESSTTLEMFYSSAADATPADFARSLAYYLPRLPLLALYPPLANDPTNHPPPWVKYFFSSASGAALAITLTLVRLPVSRYPFDGARDGLLLAWGLSTLFEQFEITRANGVRGARS